MLYREHPVSKKHKPMSIHDRAAQFSPFAALTGYDAAVKETGRLTAYKKELSEDEKNELDKALQEMAMNIHEHPLMLITYFEPDEKKAGGIYKQDAIRVIKIDEYEQVLVGENHPKIKMEQICSMERIEYLE